MDSWSVILWFNLLADCSFRLLLEATVSNRDVILDARKSRNAKVEDYSMGGVHWRRGLRANAVYSKLLSEND